MIPGKHIITSTVISIKNASPESNHREISDKTKVSGILQKACSLQKCQGEERLRSCSGFKETKEIRLLNAMCSSEVDPGLGKNRHKEHYWGN